MLCLCVCACVLLPSFRLLHQKHEPFKLYLRCCSIGKSFSYAVINVLLFITWLLFGWAWTLSALSSSCPEIVSFYGVISQRIILEEEQGKTPVIQSLIKDKGRNPHLARFVVFLVCAFAWEQSHDKLRSPKGCLCHCPTFLDLFYFGISFWLQHQTKRLRNYILPNN